MKKVKQDLVHEYSCATPKGKRFRIPEISTCPPAPKKRKIAATAKSCLPRRLSNDAMFSPPDVDC